MAGDFFIGDGVFLASIGFLAGTLAAGLSWDIVTVIGITASGLSLVRPPFWAWLAVLGSLSFGVFYCSLYNRVEARSIHMPTGSDPFLAVVSDVPTLAASGRSLLVHADLEPPYHGAVVVFTPVDSAYAYGDELQIAGDVEAETAPGDAPAVLPKNIKLVAHDRGSWVRGELLRFKGWALAQFGKVLSPDQAAFLSGETFGGTDGMSADLKNAMSASGTSYVVSMYGYKIAMIVVGLELALERWLARRARLVVAASVVVLFVIMTGWNLSAMRGAAAAVLALAARESGRAFEPRNALVLIAAAFACFDPTLPAQASFELSFLSVAGMVYLVHPLEQFFQKIFAWEPGEPGFFGWHEAVILAIASLVPIVPIISAFFGDLSSSVFPSNMLISFGVAPAFLLGVALLAVGAALPPLAVIIAKCVELVLAYQFAVVRVFAIVQIPFPFAFDSFWAFALFYGAIVWFVIAYRKP